MMQLETDRLILRGWNPPVDAQQAFDIYGDPAVTCWIGSGVADANWYETQARLQRYCDRNSPPGSVWAVIEKAIDRIIGTVLLVPLPLTSSVGGRLQSISPTSSVSLLPVSDPPLEMEIGWHFRRASWGYGYATEAARCALDYGLTHFSEIYAVALPDNYRSISVMQRLGMRDLGKTQRYYGGQTLALFCLTAAEHQLAVSLSSTGGA
ncbi:MAG: GNAT family N-acetyltransferase [Cyanobacteria bacterium J06632_22]